MDDEVGDNYMITHGDEVDCKGVATRRLGKSIVKMVLCDCMSGN